MAKMVLEEKASLGVFGKIVNFTEFQYHRMYFLVTFGTHRAPFCFLPCLFGLEATVFVCLNRTFCSFPAERFEFLRLGQKGTGLFPFKLEGTAVFSFEPKLTGLFGSSQRVPNKVGDVTGALA